MDSLRLWGPLWVGAVRLYCLRYRTGRDDGGTSWVVEPGVIYDRKRRR